ncbi:helix-turn-helix domain-containing protein [Streptomyces sp. NPDC056309]|uniref:helix-turn-helix domain-containing protein n=1 Tax=Streptomyces sp. NPDC056309 TaxID=3345781 RepID=UPI0035DDCECA
MIGPAGERVAVNLRQLRIARSMSLSDLSAKLRKLGHPLSTDAISKIENGRVSVPKPKSVRRVDVDDLLALAAALAVAPARLWAETTKCDICFGAPPPGFICAACGPQFTA